MWSSPSRWPSARPERASPPSAGSPRSWRRPGSSLRRPRARPPAVPTLRTSAISTSWCATQRRSPMPAEPETVALYITDLARSGRAASTIQRRLAAISQVHQLAGHVPPPTADWEVRQVIQGIRRSLGTAPAQKEAVLTVTLRRLVASCDPATRAGARDRALLLIGFGAALRRSELVGLDAEDVTETDEGLRLHIRRSKTDPEAHGDEVGIVRGQHPDVDPVRALQNWRRRGDITAGPLFRPVTRSDTVRRERLSPKRLPWSSSAPPAGPASRHRRPSPGTRCAPAAPPRRPWKAPRSGRSCARVVGAASPRSVATSARVTSGRRTRPPGWGCNWARTSRVSIPPPPSAHVHSSPGDGEPRSAQFHSRAGSATASATVGFVDGSEPGWDASEIDRLIFAACSCGSREGRPRLCGAHPRSNRPRFRCFVPRARSRARRRWSSSDRVSWGRWWLDRGASPAEEPRTLAAATLRAHP